MLKAYKSMSKFLKILKPGIKLLVPVLFLLLFACNPEKKKEGLTVDFVEATIKGEPGYFRVGQTEEGQWWLITPDNEPFFHKGVCAVNRAGTAGGRRAKDGPYALVVDKKYNYQASPDSFVHTQINRLNEWGFNTLGAWTTEEFFERGMPYTEIIEFFKEGPFIVLESSKKPMPDIFDPKWIQAINAKARALCAVKRNSKDLIGYFTDNEIGFGLANDFGLDLGFENAGNFGYSLLRDLLALDEGIPARDSAWAFLKLRYSTMNSLAKAWDIDISKETDFKILNNKKVSIDTDDYSRDSKDFQIIFAEKYFRTTWETIKRYDPNHLVLGCRFGSPPDTAILMAMKPWVDVISQNNYRPELNQRIDYLYKHTGLPVLIGEFSWNPDIFKYVPLPDEPDTGYSILERVSRKGEDVLLRACSHPAAIGYTWYRWVSRNSDGERFSYGLVNLQDDVEIHVPLLTSVNPLIDPLRKKIAHDGHSFFEGLDGTLAISLEYPDPKRNHLLYLKSDNGSWLPGAYGWQMEGNNICGEFGPDSAFIEIDVDFKEWSHRGNKILDPGKGHFKIALNRNGQIIWGSFTGKYNDSEIEGKAEGYFLPDLPVINSNEQH
jgi:hypothetical protein